MVQSQHWANSLRDPILKKSISKRGWQKESNGKGACPASPSLSSNSSTTKKKKKKGIKAFDILAGS
jgi:hypothetical protein